MEKREELKYTGRQLVDTHLSKPGIYATYFCGSLGDPHGVVHDGSDLDIQAIANPRYMNSEDQPVVDWGPNWKFKLKMTNMPVPASIDVVKGAGSILYLFATPEQVQNQINLSFCDKKENGKDGPTNFVIRTLCETELIKDEIGIFRDMRDEVAEKFYRNREPLMERYLEDFEGGYRKTIERLEENIGDLNLRKEFRSADRHNRYATRVVNLLTYGMCCVKNIPRSFFTVEARRKNNLWKTLGMDQDKIDQTMLFYESHGMREKLQDAAEALEEIVNEFRYHVGGSENLREIYGMRNVPLMVSKVKDDAGIINKGGSIDLTYFYKNISETMNALYWGTKSLNIKINKDRKVRAMLCPEHNRVRKAENSIEILKELKKEFDEESVKEFGRTFD